MTSTRDSEKVNPRCPDHSSHVQNVADRLYPNWHPGRIGVDGWAWIDREAETEYLNCEGH